MMFYTQDVGKQRDDHLVAMLRDVNPDVDVLGLGLALDNIDGVVQAMQLLLGSDSASDSDSDSDGVNGAEDASDDDDDTDADVSDVVGLGTSRNQRYQIDDDSTDNSFGVVFLCGSHPELAMALNEVCCEHGVQLVYVSIGKDGMSGDVLSVIPGTTSCLQCLERRKVLKLAPTTEASASSNDGDLPAKATVRACLPSTECIMAGFAVQQVFAYVYRFVCCVFKWASCFLFLDECLH
ncbi:hypothetical protein PINS_up002107 [Pythium insidiosum]|nr:hypothetical protein PINS_up002107 [Pythium insidiosum]